MGVGFARIRSAREAMRIAKKCGDRFVCFPFNSETLRKSIMLFHIDQYGNRLVIKQFGMLKCPCRHSLSELCWFKPARVVCSLIRILDTEQGEKRTRTC